MTEKKITLDQVTSFLLEATDFKPDQVQLDAVRAMVDGYVAQQVAAQSVMPADAVEAHWATLRTLMSQLLDTGGRMRLDRDGMLEDSSAPLATAADVRDAVRALSGRLQAIEKALPRGKAADMSPLMERLERMQMAITDGRLEPPDMSAVLDRSDRMERRLAAKLQSIADTPAGVTVVPADLSPVQSQLDALTRLILTQQPAGSLLETLIRDVAELCEEVAEVRAATGALKDLVVSRFRFSGGLTEYRLVPAEPVLPDWERELLEGRIGEGQAAEDEPDGGGFIPEIPVSHFTAAAVEQALDIIADLKIATRDAHYPGCFFNEDGTITCKICGTAKVPSADARESAYYKDKQSRTGYKSACKDCERKSKGAGAAA